MHPLVYDVAVSIDGYISGPDGDISGFAHDGPVVDDYTQRLAGYSVAIMGRRTYEFGYRFGMLPGQNPYPHMRTFVFSQSLQIDGVSDVTIMRSDAIAAVSQLRTEATGPVYLTGGGAFAGALLRAGLIDRLRLKRAPILLGGGTALFAKDVAAPGLTCLQTRDYGNGYLFQDYAVTAQ